VLTLFGKSGAQTTTIDNLNNLISTKKGNELIDLYVKAGREYVYTAPLKSIEYGEKAIAIGNELNDHSKDDMANLVIGSGYLFSGNFEQGKKYTDKGIEIARKNNNIEEECIGLNSLAVYWMNTGDYKQATELFKQTLDKATKKNLTKTAAMVTFNLGAIYTNQGKWTEGLNAFQEALKYFTEIGSKKFVGRTLINIAVNYHSWNNYEKALEYYQKTDKYFEEIGDMVGRFASLNNIGEIYKDEKKYDEAIKYYSQSLEIALKIQSTLNEGVAYIGLSEAYLNLKDVQKAHLYADKALVIFESIDFLEGIARCKHVLSEVEFFSGNNQVAYNLAKESNALARKAGIYDIIQQTTLIQSKILAKTGKYQEAYKTLETHNQLKDSLYNDNQAKRLAAMQTELDLKLKENEIVLLQKENEIKDLQIARQKIQSRFLFAGLLLLAIFSGIILRLNAARKKAYELLHKKNKHISEQHRELAKANETKNRFLSIIGHDLRGPVSAFSEMLGQLVDHPELFEGNLRDQILAELRKEAESTYYLLDNLLYWAKTQKETIEYKPERIDLKSIIDTNILLNSRISENKGVTLVADGKYDYQVIFDTHMLNLILRNLISNAVKFSFSGDTVKIRISDSGDKVWVEVIDNGVGIDEENIPFLFDSNKQFSTFGTANEKGSGLGLILCHEFIKNDGGEIKVTSKKGEGTTVSFTLRKS
jgi:signal transduction histidine kinase